MPVPSPLHRQQVLLRGRELLQEQEPVQALLPQVQVPVQALLPQVQVPQQREPVLRR